MAKILRKYTTIPSHLYVERNADSQIRQIIDDMDRPGYVLVARQMGKTNLLFNAKRELQSNSTIITYIDLSNVFDNERDCYRNIIDSILDSNLDDFNGVAKEIENERLVKNLPPHKEHIHELRKILNSHIGKIVIILDEIDALRTAHYSDKIFAQIRSNYFVRTNYPEFENLTYILSGVIEPTELIKDRNKSPFNIGEKIYLDDFTFEEHLEFISKSKLNISKEIIQEIYDWTSGNPRLTFDICSEVEDFLSKNEEINKSNIKEIVDKKYLTNFDVAPVDHIRELVTNNATIRNAISNIRKSGNGISSEIKSKLYLFGIINSDFNNISIKNKIIDLSLTEDWLKSVERQAKSLFEIGSDAIMKGFDVEGGIETLKEYLDSDLNIPNAQRQLSIYYIGYGYHSLYRFKESNKYLLQQIISCDISTDLHYRQKLFIGLNYLSLKVYDEGEKYLNEIINEYKDSPPYLNALLNLSKSLLEKGFEENKERSKELLQAIIRDADKVELDESDRLTINEFKTLAYYYLAEINSNDAKIKEALDLIEDSLKFADKPYIPELLFSKYILQDENNKDLIENIYEFISTNHIKFAQYTSEISFTERNLKNYLRTAFEIGAEQTFNNLFDYALSNLFDLKKRDYELYFDIAESSFNKQTSISFYKKVLELKDEIEDRKLIYYTYRHLAINHFEEPKSFEDYFDEYIILFKEYEIIPDTQDVTSFATGIRFYSDRNRINKGLELCNLIESKLDNKLEFESIIIYYWYCNLFYTIQNKEQAITYADKTIQIIKKYEDKQNKWSFLDEKGIKLIFEQVTQIKYSSITRKPIISSKQFGRNEKVKVRYLDGKEKTDKYKKLEADILAERCKVIE